MSLRALTRRAVVVAAFAIIPLSVLTAQDVVSRSKFQSDMRQLWEDHVLRTREYIIGAGSGSRELQSAAQHLMQNQTDIGNAMKEYYGERPGEDLTGLLMGHIDIAAAIVDAAMEGQTEMKNAEVARWNANADSIAGQLHRMNPGQWPLASVRKMMRTHLSLTLDEASAELSHDTAGSLAAYEKVHAEILQMADALSSGIIKQFPQRFSD